mgnify:CR=1 FL=1
MDYLEDKEFETKKSLPNNTAVLVLGIVSIVICLLGFITGTIALVLASRDLKEYRKNPHLYEESSFKNLNAGRICAIIGVSLSVLMIVVYTLYFMFVFSLVNKAIEFNQENMHNNLEYFEERLEEIEAEELEEYNSREIELEEVETIE